MTGSLHAKGYQSLRELHRSFNKLNLEPYAYQSSPQIVRGRSETIPMRFNMFHEPPDLLSALLLGGFPGVYPKGLAYVAVDFLLRLKRWRGHQTSICCRRPCRRCTVAGLKPSRVQRSGTWPEKAVVPASWNVEDTAESGDRPRGVSRSFTVAYTFSAHFSFAAFLE